MHTLFINPDPNSLHHHHPAAQPTATAHHARRPQHVRLDGIVGHRAHVEQHLSQHQPTDAPTAMQYPHDVPC